MKYIKSYTNNSEYEAAKTSADFLTPNVGYIEDTKEVKWLNSKKDLYNIYGTLTGDSATATIQINGTSYTVTPSGADNGFGLNYDQPVTTFKILDFNPPIKTIDKLNIDTSEMTSMERMFDSVYTISSIDLSHLKTNKVTNMFAMFNSCSHLTSLDLSNFETSAVTNMGAMFSTCRALTSLDLSNFVTSSVTRMKQMFRDCSNLTTLDLSNWDMSAVESTGQQMFIGCGALTTLTMNNTNTTTFDMIKTELVTDSHASHVTIIRDGVNWKYQNGAWVEA